MTLNDLYAAQIEAHFFFYLALGASTTCICLAMYICATIVAKALAQANAALLGEAQQKVVIREAVYDPTVAYNHWLNRPIEGKGGYTFAQSQ
jgi:hypothetical protein